MSTDRFDNVAFNAFAHLAGMRGCAKVADAVKDTSGLAAAANGSFAAVQRGLNATLWTGKFFRAAAGVCRATPTRPCPHAEWPWGDAVMSGTLHGQSWASALGLGALMPAEQLKSHVVWEHTMTCAYDSECSVGQQCMQGATPDSGQPGGTTGLLNQTRWANDVDPAMTMDNCANAAWWAGAGFDSPLMKPALSLIETHHSVLNDIWDWTDICHGPEGESCSGGSPNAPTGRAIAGNPELNGQYTRQVQGWMIAKAVVGQLWEAGARRLTLRPASPRMGDRLPWFVHGAAGVLEIAERPRLEVHIGRLRAAVRVVVGGELWYAEVRGEEGAVILAQR